jgi:hypothetical protein
MVGFVAGARSPREDGAPPRWWTALRALVSRLVLSTHLSRLVGRRYALYIQRMMEMFESGDIEGALRHAIPLDPGGAKQGPLPYSLSPPAPRGDLRIHARQRLTSSSTPFDLFEGLRQVYREAFRRLEAQGRIAEAAFLLAEVLNAHEEAVGFLERHGQLELAAEMAEARGLPPGLVVRQWFLAGQRERALRVARRTGAFADAVARLERGGKKEEAGVLRLLWASGLAEAGDYAAAVDAAWTLPEARPLALGWIDRAIAQGGVTAARMLARKVAVSPGPFAPIRDAVLALLEDEEAEGAAARRTFAEALRRQPATPEARVLARAAVRAVTRDSAAFGGRMPPPDFRSLVELAGDGALRADVPGLAPPKRGGWLAQGGSLRLDVDPWDTGGVAAWDAALLPDGRLAVALGETGVRLLSRAGRTVADLDQPAHRLVVSDHGDRAVAMGIRGEVWRLARLDFAARTSESWCDACVDAHAADYDGALWYVASPDGLVAIEVASPRFDGPWGLSSLPGPVRSIARSAAQAALLLGGRPPEIWRYELPSLTLRARETVEEARSAFEMWAISPRGGLLRQSLETKEGETPCLRLRVDSRLDLRIPLPSGGLPSEPVLGDHHWLAAVIRGADALRVYLVHLPSVAVRAAITLGRAERASLRLTDETLTVADDRGRVLVLDLEHGQVRRNLRLS